MSDKLTEGQTNFVKYQRVGRLATFSDGSIHVVPICPVFDGDAFYISTLPGSGKAKNLRKNNTATLLLDDYSEDWNRLVGVMIQGTADIIERGPEFQKAKKLLEDAFKQYLEMYHMKEGETIILKLNPTNIMGWDYTKK
ncbi:MAG: pyridoxamine 5'-phosphate oxidase family protein [Candidatus Bathyarchaeia archaeon]